MPRRTWKDVEEGQLYAVEWPEWRVDCAGKCGDVVLVCETGEAFTLREAKKLFKKNSQGWVKRKRRWYCPKCAKQKGG